MKSQSQCLIRFCVSLLAPVVATMSGGCGMNVEKSIYDSMQYEKEQQCLRDPSRNSPACVEHKSYETYERQRQGSP